MATVRTAKPRSFITLNFSSADRVMVVPEDGDRFVMTAEKAVEACRRADNLEAEARRRADEDGEVLRRFEQHLLRPLRAWCEQNTERVSACFVPVPRGSLWVYVVGRTPHYDFDLGRDLAEFELKLVEKGWRVHTMLVPRPDEEDGLRTHFDYDGALEVYAESHPAPNEG